MKYLHETKTVLALLTAAFAGIILGVGAVISIAAPDLAVAGPTEWIGEAESVGQLAVVGAAATASAWIIIDYRYEVGVDG